VNRSQTQSTPNRGDAIGDTAASWVVRHDRGLSFSEKAELDRWLGTDPQHAAAYEQASASWLRVRQIASLVQRTPVASQRRGVQWQWIAAAGLAAAASFFIIPFGRESGPAIHAPAANSTAGATAPSVRELADGSLIQLRTGAEISEAFTANERRVRLVRGEAFFVVAKDAARPFLVEIGNVTVRAVGTAFAIRQEALAVDVLVTEGIVQVIPPATDPTAPEARPAVDLSALVGAGQRAIVTHEAVAKTPAVVVTMVSSDELAKTRAWGEQMLELGGSTLGELVKKFTDRSGRPIVIEDKTLAAERLGGKFPTNDFDGFFRALSHVYNVELAERADGVIVLRKKP
jgi:transmembrane sensor